MVKDFEPEQYKDEYREKLWEIINQKIQGREIVVPKEEENGNVLDIMEALRKSLEQADKAG